MNKIANVHCHFMNTSHLPDEYIKRLLKNQAPGIKIPDGIGSVTEG